MLEQEIYEKLVDWLGKTWWGLPDSDQLMPIIRARYTLEEAEFLIGMPFHGSSLEELAKAKSRDPMGNCLHFDTLGRYCVENGLGREITREEAEQILKESADAGLIHGVSNWREKPDTICNCCSCCCIWMDAYHLLHHHKSLDSSNYKVKVNPETCKACGLCVKRCPMDALQLKYSEHTINKHNKAAVLEQELCIGCGVCVHKCPTDSLILERNQEIVDPPENIREYSMRFMANKKKGVPLLRK